MKAIEKYIKEHTEEGSSPIIDWDGNIAIYQPWITAANAREVSQIAREETINEVSEWIENNVAGYCVISDTYDVDGCIKDMKEYLNYGKVNM